jgi:DNA-binding transcriptional LysR family regulator
MRFKGFDLNLLVALEALLTEKSVSRAAERLNISQPAASAALSRLRTYFHDDILSSSGKRMFPTSHAESLAPVLAEVLAGVEKLIALSTVFDPATSRRVFRIGASDYITTVLLTPLMPTLERLAPGVRLEISLPSERMVGMLERGEIDLIMTPEPYTSPDHPADLLFEESHVVVGWSGNPVFKESLTADAFFELGHIIVEMGAAHAPSFADTQLGDLGRQRRVEVIAPSFSAVPWMLPNTHRLAMMHERLARKLAPSLPLTIAPLPFDFPVMREMVQYHRTRIHDAGLGWLIEKIRVQAEETEIIN